MSESETVLVDRFEVFSIVGNPHVVVSGLPFPCSLGIGTFQDPVITKEIVYSSEYHGDHSENWIIVFSAEGEIARYSTSSANFISYMRNNSPTTNKGSKAK